MNVLHQMIASAVTSAGSRLMNAKAFQRSRCGEDFDAYIYKAIDAPFPFSPVVGAASRKLPELWKNRRFKLHYHGKWREGKIIMWEQYNPTPNSMVTCWSVVVELDTVEEGDEVELKLVGEVCSDSSTNDDDCGTVKITSDARGESKDMCIKPTDGASIVPRMKLYVHRLNVEGGGTVKLSSGLNERGEEDENVTLLSLEWLEPASPSVNLNDDLLSFDCPCCRKAEPVMAAFEDPSNTTIADCPVCLERTELRVLGCGHGVCHSCWNSCRQAATRVSVELDDLDEEEVTKERANRNRLYGRKRSRDGGIHELDFMQTFAQLAEDSTNRQGLHRLRWELMVEHPAVWTTKPVLNNFDSLCKEALQVIYQVVQDRKEDMRVPSDNGTECDRYGDAAHYCCYSIAKIHRRDNEYREAVPWAELSLHYAIHSQVGRDLASSYLFTSQIHVTADMLSKGLEEFDAGTALVDDEERHLSNEARDVVTKIMMEWTGTSGNLTPGA